MHIACYDFLRNIDIFGYTPFNSLIKSLGKQDLMFYIVYIILCSNKVRNNECN